MKKHKVLTCILTCTTLLSCVAFSSGTIIDPVLEHASHATKQLLYSDIEENLFPYVSSSYLKGADGEKDYILSQTKTGGYAIYEKTSMRLIEYSNTSVSPYHNIEENSRCYMGPINYFRFNEDKIQHLISKKNIPKKSAEKFAQTLKEKIRKRQKKGLSEKKNSLSLQSLPAQSDMIDANSNNFSVLSRKYIPKYQFFLNNDSHGYNNDGTCATIATQLLLAFNNWGIDARLIPYATNNPQEKFLPDITLAERLQPYGVKMKTTTSSDYRYDNEISFYEKLKSYITPYARSLEDINNNISEHPNNNGATMQDIKEGILQYINDYAPVCATTISINVEQPLLITDNSIEEISQILQYEIDHGRPAIAGMEFYIPDLNKTKGHAIVVYGYQTILQDQTKYTGFIAHLGYDFNKTHIWINSDWIIDCLTFQSTHEHNNIQSLDEKSHIYECNECHGILVQSNHTEKASTLLESSHTNYYTHHTAICACGYEYQAQHEFLYGAKTGKIEHSDDTHHLVICNCGYEEVEPHYYKYQQCFYCEYIP